MSDNHQHAAPTQAPTVRQPSAISRINRLQASLNDRAHEIRVLQDEVANALAIADDQENEIAALRAMLDQVSTEARILRKRLDLPETGPLELSDEEADTVPAEQVVEEPDAVVAPEASPAQEEPIIDAEIVEQGD